MSGKKTLRERVEWNMTGGHPDHGDPGPIWREIHDYMLLHDGKLTALTSRAEAAEAQVAALLKMAKEIRRDAADICDADRGAVGYELREFAAQVHAQCNDALSSLPASPATEKLRAREPTEEMLIAARDWSQAKYGKPIGNDAAIGCWQAMYDAGDK